MTKPKPYQYTGHLGRKPRRLKNSQDKLLKMLFDAGDVAPFDASCYTQCGYDYALKKYKIFYAHLIPSEIVARIIICKQVGYKGKL